MTREARYYFEGSLSDQVLRRSDIENVHGLVERLNEQSFQIEEEISRELAKRLHAEVVADIQFEEGSFEWYGWIEVTWNVLEAMSTIGGAIGLVGIMGSAISRVLRRVFPRRVRGKIYTHVRVVSAPVAPQSDRETPSLLHRALIYSLLVTNLLSLTAIILILILILKHGSFLA